MQQSVRIWSVLALMLALLVAPAAPAQEADAAQRLQEASDLFNQQDYVAAQQKLSDIDRDDLGEREQADYDLLLEVVIRAIAANEEATRVLAEADAAFEAGEWDKCDSLYASVIDNKFAKDALKERATAQRIVVAEKKGLAQAAAPDGIVEDDLAEAEAEAASAALPPTDPQRVTPIDEIKLRDSLHWQRAAAHAQDLSARARQAVTEGRYTEARQLAEAALQKIEAARSYAEPVSKYLAARDAAERLKQEVATAAEADMARKAADEQVQVLQRVKQRRELLEQQRREKIEQLFNTASQLRRQQQFSEAAEVLRQILHIDPANAKARDQLEIAEDYASLHAQKAWHGDLQRQTRSALESAEQALIPWDYEILYPKNWLELTARRSARGIGSGGEPEDTELNRKLDEVLPEFDFQEAPFEAVMEHLQEMQDINIAMDWEDLEANGIDRDKPVTILLRGLPFRTVLEEVLTQVGGDIKLAFEISDGLLRIATKDKLDLNKAVLVYDIRDLLVNVPRFNNAATMDPSQALNQMGQGGQGGGGGGNQLFQNNNQQQQTEQGQGQATDIVERIMEIIRQTVEPDSWVDTGGGDASIRELNGQLIIYNTSDAHGQIRGLLDQLRATRALQIAMEARFLNVTSNFLEEFGVDLDFVFNSGSAGYDQGYGNASAALRDPATGAIVLVPRTYSQIGSLPATPGFGTPIAQGNVIQPYGQAGLVPTGTGILPHINEMTPITAQQSSLALTDPGSISTTVPGSFAQSIAAPALNIAGSFLDNLQVDFLIRATQANRRSSIVQAPRLVMFNGQRANISIGRSRSYVSSVQPQIGEQVVGVQPIISQAQSGTVLVVEGTISADRRYVTVTVETSQTDEPSFEKFITQQASGNSPSIYVSLPNQSFVTLNTTVSIPDGGTVLLGGMKQVGEVEVEAGVPILSKIPILKRAFTNTTTVKDTRTLLVLMKAKIIIQREAEEEAFPTFTAMGG